MAEQEKTDEATGADEQPAAEEGVVEVRRPARGAVAPAGPATAVVAAKRVPGTPVISRRRVLAVGFWASVGAAVAAAGGCGVDLLYPRHVKGFGGKVSAGDVSQYPPGSKTKVQAGRFWLVNLTEEQGGPGLLALWWKCPHLGCTVPWRPDFIYPDPTTGAPKQGWFKCPCHGSTYTDAGVRVFGPAPRSLDTMALSVGGGRISVDTGKITKGSSNNPDRAVRV